MIIIFSDDTLSSIVKFSSINLVLYQIYTTNDNNNKAFTSSTDDSTNFAASLAFVIVKTDTGMDFSTTFATSIRTSKWPEIGNPLVTPCNNSMDIISLT